MFLRNLFLGKPSDQSSQLHKYDRITFHININENIPEISQQAKTIQQDQHQLTPNHPLYYEIFKKQQKQQETQQYITKEDDDTLMGIALKLNINVDLLKSMNGFSGDQLFPKMKIKIPKTADITLLQDKKPQQMQGRPKISELFLREHESKGTAKYELYYCAGAVGNIRGTLNLNPNYIMFNPHIQDEQNKASFSMQKLLKFNAIIQIQDIKQVLPIDIPTMSQDNDNPQTAYIVQLLLFKIGNKKIQEKYKQRLKQLKLDHKAIASISFKMLSYDQKGKEMQAEIVERIDTMIKNVEPERQSEQGLTSIPFFDILYHNIATKKSSSSATATEEKEQKRRKTSLINIKQVGSDSVLPHQAFIEIATYFPLLYQLHNWTLVYSCMQHGTSFHTMLRACSSKDPLLLIVKEYKGNIFGAYLAQPLAMGKTGRGEMFLWRYEPQTKKVDVYEWTHESQFFCFADSDGLGIGMGTKYGIFLNNTLEKGHSGETKTFGNPQLSVKEDFEIEDVEVWGIDEND